MFLLSAQEFNKKSELGNNSLERLFENKILTAGPIFSLANYKAAELYCKRWSKVKNNSLCIVVKENNFFRIWSEDSYQNSNDRDSLDDKNKIDNSSLQEKKISPNSLPVETEFVEICQKKLACEIGPIAQMICKKILAKKIQLTRLEFVEILAKKISDPELAQQFKQELLE